MSMSERVSRIPGHRIWNRACHGLDVVFGIVPEAQVATADGPEVDDQVIEPTKTKERHPKRWLKLGAAGITGALVAWGVWSLERNHAEDVEASQRAAVVNWLVSKHVYRTMDSFGIETDGVTSFVLAKKDDPSVSYRFGFEGGKSPHAFAYIPDINDPNVYYSPPMDSLEALEETVEEFGSNRHAIEIQHS